MSDGERSGQSYVPPEHFTAEIKHYRQYTVLPFPKLMVSKTGVVHWVQADPNSSSVRYCVQSITREGIGITTSITDITSWSDFHGQITLVQK